MSQRKRKPGRAGSSSAAGSSTVVSAAAQTTSEPPASSPQSVRARERQLRQAAAAQAEEHWIERYSARAEMKNAEARAKLVPLPANEHPWPLKISITLALIFSLGTLVLMVAGVKVDGKPPATSWIFYVLVMFACAVGMWRHWFQAVLAFMCLLGIALVILCALVVRFSNLLGLIVPLVLIVLGGALFWKLVGVLARIQMPQRPSRSVQDG